MRDETIGLIPAAGKGQRLGLPYPKELFPVIVAQRYKPVSEFVLENICAAGVSHTVFVINSTKHQLIDYFGDGSRFQCHLSYVVQEHRSEHGSSSPGLARALDSAWHLTSGRKVFFGMADTIMSPADIFCRADKAVENDNYDAVLILFPTSRPQEAGMVALDATNRVLQVIDKPRESKLTMMWGAIIWRPRFTEHLHAAVMNGVSDFAEIINTGIQSGLRICGVHVPGSSYVDVGTFASIGEIEKHLSGSRARAAGSS